MQFTGPPKLNDWTAPSTAYQTPLDAAWEDEGEWVEYRSGKKEQAGTRKLRGRFFVAWTGLDYETASRILHELRGDTVTFTPRTQLGSEQVSIDVDGDGTDEEVLQEIAVSCRVASELPTSTELRRRFSDGTQEARLEVRLETIDTFEDLPGFIPAAADPANPQFTTVVNSFNGRTGDVALTSTDVIDALGYAPADGGSVVSSTLVHERDPDPDAYWSWHETEGRWGQQLGTSAFVFPLLPNRDETVTGQYSYEQTVDFSALGNDAEMIQGGTGAHRTLYASDSPGLDVRLDTNDSGYAHIRFRRSSTADVFLEADTRNGASGLKWLGNTVLTDGNAGNLPAVDEDATVTGLWTFEPGLKIDGDAHIKGDGAGAVEVLAADGTNTGILRVDRAIVNSVEVVDSIDQTTVNELAVSDQYIIVNEGQTGTPSLNGGLMAERGDQADAVLIQWDEGLDDVVTGLDGQTMNRIVHAGNADDVIGDLYVNEDGDTMTGDLTMDEGTQSGATIHAIVDGIDLYKQGTTDPADLNVGTLDAVTWHLDLDEVQDVDPTGRDNAYVIWWDADNTTHKYSSISDLVSELGTLRIGTVGIASDGKFTVSTDPPPAPDGDPATPPESYVDGYIWLRLWDSTGNGVREQERYVWDASDATWDQLSTGIAGGILANETIVTQHIESQSLAVGNATINTAQINSLTAGIIQVVNDTAQSSVLITGDGIDAPSVKAKVFSGQDATISNSLQVGTGDPHVVIDGSTARIESSNYASRVSGMRLTGKGFLEVNDILARGTFSTSVFEFDTTSYVAGGLAIVAATTLAQAASAGDTTLYLRGQIVSAGDYVKLSDVGKEDMIQVSSVDNSPSVGAQAVTLSTGLANAWGAGTGVQKAGAEGILHQGSGQTAPFSSYTREDGSEFMREGNLSGRAGLAGYGIVIGNNEFVYRTDEDVLKVIGEGRFSSGEIGPYSIGAKGIFGPMITLSEEAERLAFLNGSAGTDLNLITNRDFLNSDANGQPTGWQELNETDAVVDSDTDGSFIRTPASSAVTWNALQQVDYSAQEGTTVRFDVTVKGTDSNQSVTFKVTDEVTGNALTSLIMTPSSGALETYSITTTLPKADGSQIMLRLRMDAHTNDTPAVYSVKSFGTSVYADYGVSGVQLFDDAGAKTVDLARSEGTLELGGGIGLYGTTAPLTPSSLTPKNASTVDTTYGVNERDVIQNNRARIGELETILQGIGLLS